MSEILSVHSMQKQVQENDKEDLACERIQFEIDAASTTSSKSAENLPDSEADDDDDSKIRYNDGAIMTPRSRRIGTNPIKEIFNRVSMPTSRKSSQELSTIVDNDPPPPYIKHDIMKVHRNKDSRIFSEVWRQDLLKSIEAMKLDKKVEDDTSLRTTTSCPPPIVEDATSPRNSFGTRFSFRSVLSGLQSASTSRSKPVQSSPSPPSNNGLGFGSDTSTENFLSRVIGSKMFERTLKKASTLDGLLTEPEDTDMEATPIFTPVATPVPTRQDMMTIAEVTSNKMPLGESQEDMEREWQAWLNREQTLLTNWNDTVARNIRRRVTKGVAKSLRGRVWLFLSHCPLIKPGPPTEIAGGPTNKEQPRHKFRQTAPPGTYWSLINKTSSFETEIRRDIARTYPTHPKFAGKDSDGQRALFNILKVYSLFDPEMGYCQGLAFIVGVLVMHVEEEEAFNLLSYLMNVLNLRELFLPVMEPLLVALYQLSRVIYDRSPKLHAHLLEHGIRESMYASQWFLTLFASQFHLPLVFRVIDMLMIEGQTFLLKMSLALLNTHEADVLKCKTFEDILAYLKYGLPNAYTRSNISTNDNSNNINAKHYAGLMAGSVSADAATDYVSVISDQIDLNGDRSDQEAAVTGGIGDSDLTEPAIKKNRKVTSQPLTSHSIRTKLPETDGAKSDGGEPRSRRRSSDKHSHRSIANDNTAEDEPHPTVQNLIDLALSFKISDAVLYMLTNEFMLLKEGAEANERERLLRDKLIESKLAIEKLEYDQRELEAKLLEAYDGFSVQQKAKIDRMTLSYEATIADMRLDYEKKMMELQQTAEDRDKAQQIIMDEIQLHHEATLNNMLEIHRTALKNNNLECKAIVERVGKQCKELIDGTVKVHKQKVDELNRILEEKDMKHEEELIALEERQLRMINAQNSQRMTRIGNFIKEHQVLIDNLQGISSADKRSLAEFMLLRDELLLGNDIEANEGEVNDQDDQQTCQTIEGYIDVRDLGTGASEEYPVDCFCVKTQSSIEISDLQSTIGALKKKNQEYQDRIGVLENRLREIDENVGRPTCP